MGYLDNSSITVDAILTKRGRELLSRNDGSFKITQFALSDDEIDYSLFNESHPNGTQYSAEAIENMPLIEAIPNGANSLNSKLITLTRGANSIPYIQTAYGTTGITVIRNGSFTVSPTTYNLDAGAGTTTEEYIFTILDERLSQNFTATGGTTTASASDVEEFSTIATSKSVRGKVLTMVATDSTALFSSTILTRTTSIAIEGVTSGAIITLPLTVNYS